MSKYSLDSINQDVAYKIVYIGVLELWIDMQIESSYSAGQTVPENDSNGTSLPSRCVANWFECWSFETQI